MDSKLTPSINAIKTHICMYSGKFSYDTKYKIMEIVMKQDGYKKYIKTNNNSGKKGTDIFLDKLPDKMLIEIYDSITK